MHKKLPPVGCKVPAKCLMLYFTDIAVVHLDQFYYHCCNVLPNNETDGIEIFKEKKSYFISFI